MKATAFTIQYHLKLLDNTLSRNNNIVFLSDKNVLNFVN